MKTLMKFQKKYKGHKFHYATTKANHVHSDVTYGMDDMLVFGKETAGIPESILKRALGRLHSYTDDK